MVDRTKILELAELGLGIPAIAKRLRCSRETVRKALIALGKPMPRAMRGDGKLHGRVHRLLAWAEKHGVSSAAKRFKVSRQAVYYHKVNNG